MKIAAEKTERKTADKLFNFRPMFFAAIFLCFGILFGYFSHCLELSPLWSLLLLPTILLSLLFCENKEKRKKAIAAWSILLVCFLFGLLSFSAKIDDFRALTAYNKETTVRGRVVNITSYNGYSNVELDDLIIDGKDSKATLSAYLPASFCENLRLSDVLLLTGYVSTDTEVFNEYGFRAQDIRKNRCYQISKIESYTVVTKTFDVFLFVRSRMSDVVYAGMEEGSAAVTMAVLTGDTSGIEQNLYDNIRAGGIAHVFAVSGLHIGSLYAFCMLFMRKTSLRKLPKVVRFFLTAVVLILYSGVCGFTASSVRATIVCLVTYATVLVGVKNDFLQSLGISAILILVLAPTALFEVGFQLSFAACLGLALLTRPIQHVFTCAGQHTKNFFASIFVKGEPKPQDEDAPVGIFTRLSRKAVALFSVSLAAQIATAPILLKNFGYVSGWSLLLNVLFVPLISVTFAFLLLLTLVACVLPITWSGAVLYLPSVLWQALLLVFEAFDFSTFAWTRAVSNGAVVTYYIGWLFTTDKWNISARLKWTLGIGCFLAFAVTMVALNV